MGLPITSGKSRLASTLVVRHSSFAEDLGPSGEQIETDMPPVMGGAGTGPNPGWFFRASLAACCSTVIAAQAARLGINLTKLKVTVEGTAIFAECSVSITAYRPVIPRSVRMWRLVLQMRRQNSSKIWWNGQWITPQFVGLFAALQ